MIKITIKGPKTMPKLRIDTQNMMSRSDANTLGKMVVYAMKDLISKGISPIRSVGRFEGYKWAEGAKIARKEAQKIEDPRLRRAFNKDIKGQLQQKYPYSQMKKHPDKKVRPVNLKLSGNFLNDLGYKIESGRMGAVAVIQYLTQLSNKKEQGHREGVNGQPSRPTIPRGGEEPAQSIKEIILGAYRHSVKKFLSTKVLK